MLPLHYRMLRQLARERDRLPPAAECLAHSISLDTKRKRQSSPSEEENSRKLSGRNYFGGSVEGVAVEGFEAGFFGAGFRRGRRCEVVFAGPSSTMVSPRWAAGSTLPALATASSALRRASLLREMRRIESAKSDRAASSFCRQVATDAASFGGAARSAVSETRSRTSYRASI